jgi:hypothetical protein
VYSVVPAQTRRHPAAEEKTVILPPFWAARPVARFIFTERKSFVKRQSQRRRFDLLLAAMPEKIMDLIMDVAENVPVIG